jgi:hypothetical protein
MEERKKEERKKENTFIGLHIQVKQIQELQKNRSKYTQVIHNDTRKCSTNSLVSAYASAALRECRRPEREVSEREVLFFYFVPDTTQDGKYRVL